MRHRRSFRRRGISLLESLLAVAILFISFAAIYSLLDIADRQARMVRDQSLAVQACQSKLNEIVAGALSIGGGGGEVDELPGWEWSSESTADDVDGLYRVTVRVNRKNSDNPDESVTLEQIVMDPAKRGSALDEVPVRTTEDMTTQPMTGGTTTQPMTGGTTTQPMTGGTTTQPKTGGTTTKKP